MAKKATKAVKRPMVPTTDKMKLPNKGTVTIKVKPRVTKKVTKKEEPHSARLTKAERFAKHKAAFFRDGLLPEERLLKAIYGKDIKVDSVPKSKRTDELFSQLMEQRERRMKMADKEKKATKNKTVKIVKKADTATKKAVTNVDAKKIVKKTVKKPAKAVKAVKKPIDKKGKK